MSRPRSYTIAALLLVLYSLVALLFELPNLARGAAPSEDAPPFALSLVNFTLAILGFVAVYGIWRVQKWGVVLAIAVCGLSILTSLPAIIFAPDLPFRVGGIVSIAWLVAMIALLLRPTGGRQRLVQEAHS